MISIKGDLDLKSIYDLSKNIGIQEINDLDYKIKRIGSVNYILFTGQKQPSPYEFSYMNINALYRMDEIIFFIFVRNSIKN